MRSIKHSFKYLLIIVLTMIFPGFFLQSIAVSQKTDTVVVFQFSILEEIAPPAWHITQKSFQKAHEAGASYILLHLNTYGGLVDAADSIRTKILNSPIPVIAFIDDNAASAGALIAIACDQIYMRKGAKIGAATVVNMEGKAMPDKYQAYMRATMRATAEAHGKDTIINGKDTIFKWKRDPLIAEAMVDPRTYIPGIIDTGKVLTFTTSEAIKFGYCEGEAQNVHEVLKQAGISNYRLEEYTPTLIGMIIKFLINPVVHGLLIMIIVGGIYFELQTPGVGFPLVAAITAALLYFAPLYLEGLAANWEILIFIAGIGLLLLEIFVIPGFGVAGISGIILAVAGLTMSMVENFDFSWDAPQMNKIMFSFLLVIVSMITAFIGSLLLGRKILISPELKVALHDTQRVEEGFIGVKQEITKMVGKTGTAATILRPAGKVDIDGVIIDAVAETSYIEAGSKVVISRSEASQIYVRKI